MKKIIRIVSAITLLLSFCYLASAQNGAKPAQLMGSTTAFQIIKGHVIDAQTKKPVVGANVYLNGTYLGTSTNATGNFSLSAERSNIPLIVSYVGYETQTINNYDINKDLEILLKAKELKEVDIAATDDMSRERKMKMFLTEFIGSTNKDCVITNPDDIWLRYNGSTNTLTAGADKPLTIVNKKLGYKITYFLNNFKFVESVRGNDTRYGGNCFFAEDTVGLNPDEIKKVLKERDDAYYGSRMHFVRSLWADELAKNNFKLLEPTITHPRMTEYDEKESKKLFYKDIVAVKNDHIFHDQKYFVLPTEVSILYQPKKHKDGTSYLKQKKDYEGVLIDSNGYCGDGVGWNGDMGNDRVNRLLPFEFQPIGK